MTGDRWDEPRSVEHGDGSRGWNVAAEVHVPILRRVGALLNVGRKTAGFVPGRPLDAGAYAGFGLLVSPW